MCRGAYDLQKLRIQCGLRLCGNFRSKLKIDPNADNEEIEDGEELSDQAQSILAQLKASYRTLTEGVARNRTLPREEGFEGDALISTFTELTLVDQFVRLDMQETLQFRQMTSVLERIPIYTKYLRDERGIGPAMASVLISYFDPAKARHVSNFWAFAGLDVAPDGRARSRRAEHLVEREYVDRDGDTKKRWGITYDPFLRTKILGVLATNFLRSGSRWREVYDGYKFRLETDPGREKASVVEWKKRRKAGKDVANLWTPGRIHRAALRYMVKMFVAEFWVKWRELEGLPVTPTYHEAKLGHRHAAE
jgi:hypothetical protein